MAIAATLGFPRIGAHRELKTATEAFWKGEIDEAALRAAGADLRARHWAMQKAAGIAGIPSNDFSFYDQMLDMTATLGAMPPRFGAVEDEVSLGAYFAMARGAEGVPAMEMTKWFDTNYHFLVPEVRAGQTFRLASLKAVREFEEAKAQGIHTRPVIIGPVTWFALAKSRTPGLAPLELLPAALPVYVELLDRLAAAGADWVQVDEPILATDLGELHRAAFWTAYDELAKATPRLMVTSYFGGLGPNLAVATKLPVAGLHIDLVRAPEQLEPVLAALAPDARLSIGVIDGRNVWRADLEAALAPVARAVAALGSDRVEVAPSCSLLHVPFDTGLEADLDPEIHAWLAFARQKLDEVVSLTAAANGARGAVASAFERSAVVAMARAASPRIHDAAVKARAAAVSADDLARRSPYATRAATQAERLGLPRLPTTTIGSFPQTAEVRRARADGAAYLRWAVDAFRLSAAGVRDATQIHTHMCYSEFNDIMPSIAELDADVISIETSRSDMDLLTVFGDFAYPNEIGPGVWDIHSPRVPPEEEIVGLLRKALAAIPAERLWVNPDCGLKTRGWAEVEPAIRNLVAAARRLRAEAAAPAEVA